MFVTVMKIVTPSGTPASRLGLGAHPQQDPQCVLRAFDSGINFFFVYESDRSAFTKSLKPLVQRGCRELVLATGSEARRASDLRAAYHRFVAATGTEVIDIFFAEYVHPSDDAEAVFGQGGVLDELQRWKTEGWIRFVGASAHDRTLAKRLVNDARVDVLMLRYNMAHRKVAGDVFPMTMELEKPLVAFTATRWGTLLGAHPAWHQEPPLAADCYQYCLSHAAIHHVLTASESLRELDQNLNVLRLPPMTDEDCRRWERYGDLIYHDGGGKAHDFESRWP